MKRMNSSSWKKPFDGDIRHSQDSVISSQSLLNSQCQEFSQVSTQDLFGQNTGSQNEQQSNQKMSMYEKWLSLRSKGMTNWASKGTKGTDGPGRFENRLTPSSAHGLSLYKQSSEEKDDRDFFEHMMNSFCDSRNEIKTLSTNLKGMFATMGGTFSDEAKQVLSSFMEEFSKKHEELISRLQVIEKERTLDKELQEELSSKNCQISSLESRLKVLDEQVNKGDDKCKADQIKEEIQSSHLLQMKRLEEISDSLSHNKQEISQHANNVRELKDDLNSTEKGLQRTIKDFETRITRDMKKLPQDLKSTMNIQSEVLTSIEGLSAEMHHSLQNTLHCFSKDIKNDMSKQSKKYSDQTVKKHFDKICGKMDDLATEHQNIQQYVKTNIQESFYNHLKDIDESMKNLTHKLSVDPSDVKQIKQSVTQCQQEHSQHLQNVITQQRQLNKQVQDLFDIVKAKNSYKNTPIIANDSLDPNSDQSPEKSFETTQRNELVEKTYNAQEISQHYQCPTPNNIFQKVNNRVNNISMPVINQTNNIYPPHKCKSIYPSHMGQHSILTEKSAMDGTQNLENSVPFISPFHLPLPTYSKYRPSPVATVKPQRHAFDDSLMSNNSYKENQQICKPLKTMNNDDTNEYQPYKKMKTMNNDDANEYQPYKKMKNTVKPRYVDLDYTHDNGYWLRRRSAQIGHGSGVNVRNTPVISKNVRSFSTSAQTKCTSSRKRQLDESGMRKKFDSSIYDFKDESDNFSRARSKTQNFNCKGSQASSPALTINFDWAKR